ncbi:hypothetical protein OG874_00650 [Nocardia sp. NBC_00565]|uniref:hypothetical protein n=1 Tax=Nocardia sp. NBC_00565 TaxID=2975993 RepID=UPI002E80C588|nr:hypothetical protein [Nocardia sp. NBC_00565]WUC03765.1 hypothetical protein OG874_00650 [Nocardia sp. NBC_00565]
MQLSRLKVTITDEKTAIFLPRDSVPVDIQYIPEDESFLYYNLPDIASVDQLGTDKWLIWSVIPGGIAPVTDPAYQPAPAGAILLNIKGLWTEDEHAVYVYRVGSEPIYQDENSVITESPINASYPAPPE